MAKPKSLFLEGTDGSGKSTQFKLLQDYLSKQNVPFIALREPGGSEYYEALRDFYLHTNHPHPPISDALLSAAGRAANREQSQTALASGSWVITDRAYPSSYVYQAVQGVPLDHIKTINQFALDAFDYDIKILLDVPVEVAQARVDASGTKKDYWESQGREFFLKIREKYLELAEQENYVVIDASADVQIIHQKIVEILGI